VNAPREGIFDKDRDVEVNMKKLIPILICLMATVSLADLQDVLDGITIGGSSHVTVPTDAIPDAEDSNWSVNASGGSLLTVVSPAPPNGQFGVYDRTNPSLRVQVLNDSAAIGVMALITMMSDGSVWINGVDTGVDFAGNAFGFYLDSPVGLFYSDTRLNGDAFDHMLALPGEWDTIQIDSWSPGLWYPETYALGWEATSGGGDQSYDDFVAMIDSVTPIATTSDGGGCRFTGGGVDTDGNWDHTLENGEMVRNGAGNLPVGIDRAQFGGQAGANTGQQPQPKGEWTHHQQTGPSGSFTFHGGTASAPAGTEIYEIRCSDPGGCKPSGDPPSPAKQLDFDGIGTFKSIGNGKKAPIFEIANPNVTAEGKGNKTFDGTFHWFEVNVDDLGEPGGMNKGAPDSAECPSIGFGEKGAEDFANCDCPDFYRITIYDGVNAADVIWLDDYNIDPSSLNQVDVIYEFYGYIDGGNLQIHRPTGFDL
jgi:hypothetical protein